ncbi:MAG TPA: PQQ-binding-like beta-propeller repeat protein [Candidatus Cybelea sp.]|nr:PQQ-binding-like beta-propeller repeat protein [Candidatus Cybelea sp.]
MLFGAVVVTSTLATAACGARPQAVPNVELGGIGQTSGSTDSWPTFAYNNLRQGLNPTVTNLTPTSVPSLALRWQQSLGDEIFSSPVVYDGNLIVVTLGTHSIGSVVYDLSTTDGHVIWKYVMHSQAKMTPAIDPDAGLVFVGNEQKKRRLPSYVFALNLLTGSLVWRQEVHGLVRGALMVANGTVYAGRAGGDPPLCLQGGLVAINEVQGNVEWSWNVDPAPKEGGSVWGAMAYDGAHVIFGTGNTCKAPVPTANGAVALNPDGSVAWNTVAVKRSTADADTGGGVMLYDGLVHFMSKNGSFYAVNAGSGDMAWSADLNPFARNPSWRGGFASPTTDGTTIVVGTGLYAGSVSGSGSGSGNGGGEFCLLTTAKPNEVFNGYHSELQGISESGAVLWKDTMQNRLVGYVALVPGIGFVGLNKDFVAVDLSNGQTLWSYPTQYFINASMVVVPSGVYGADQGGNVFAFSLPSSSARRHR